MSFPREGRDMNEYQKGSPGRKKGHTCFCSSGRKARAVSCMSLLSEILLHSCVCVSVYCRDLGKPASERGALTLVSESESCS